MMVRLIERHIGALLFAALEHAPAVALLGPRVPAETLRRLWTMLAHNQSQLLNVAMLARSLAIDGKTVARYLDLLVDLLLVRRVQPWHGNAGKRLVKSPKGYVRDSGIVHALLRLPTREDVLGHPVAGGRWGSGVGGAVAAAAVMTVGKLTAGDRREACRNWGSGCDRGP